MTVQQQRDQR